MVLWYRSTKSWVYAVASVGPRYILVLLESYGYKQDTIWL